MYEGIDDDNIIKFPSDYLCVVCEGDGCSLCEEESLKPSQPAMRLAPVVLRYGVLHHDTPRFNGWARAVSLVCGVSSSEAKKQVEEEAIKKKGR